MPFNLFFLCMSRFFSTLIKYSIFMTTQLTSANISTKIIAHRGASRIMPENTMKAFQVAKDLSADFIELDVHLSSSKVPIVIHDLELVKLYENEKISGTSQNRKLLKVLKGEKIPTLLEVLINFLDTSFMIEIKHGSASDFDLALETLKIIAESKHEKVKIASFSPFILQEVHKIDPNMKLIGIVDDNNINYLKDFLKLKVEIIAAKQSLANLDFINKIHQLNLKIWVWTVNNKNSIKKFAGNIEGIITDDIVLAKSILD